jgi:purine-binding chemotaxis protein CheW
VLGSIIAPIVVAQEKRASRAERRGANDAPALAFLGFTLGDEEFGADLNIVGQIVKPPPITWVPRAQPHLLGVISIRGKVVTLVDLRQLLGLEPTAWPKTARVLLMDRGGESMGLLVDAVTHVHRVSLDQFETGVALESGVSAEYVLGVARPAADVRVTIVDMLSILTELVR